MEFSPREFMKKRRPERFSDTVVVNEAKLNRKVLEYNLSTLTSRNDERLFESFAVKLAQVEICPNLRVQTGPVGGGDSKADSETYPVSDLTQLSFYEGHPNPENDRWAFAVSAKKTWTTKVSSDVEGIISTGRDYKKIFFITSQFAKDKKRAELEDSLSEKYRVSVTILDLNWILDRIFKNDRIKLAVEELNLGDGLEEVTIPGQLDTARLKELEEINKFLEDAISKKEITQRVLKKSLKAAILARELERPKSIVDGLFDRAIRITTQFGSSEQLFHIRYQQAWTTYFWHEDYEQFIKLYDQCEELASGSHNIFVGERLNNLWQVLKTMSGGVHPVSEAYLQGKFENLRNFLTIFVINESAPSAALQAQAILTINKLLISPAGPEVVSEVFEEMRHIFKVADMLIGFPYESLWESVQELGSLFPENESFEKLINDMMDIDMKRKGDVPVAISSMQFGIKQYKIGQPYKAIDYLGKCLAKLFKEESKDDFVNALYWLGKAYEDVGLLWAARGAWINAASFATSDYWKYNSINWMQSLCYSKLKYIELRLGRVAQSLEWHQLDYIISKQLAKTEEEHKEVFNEAYYEYGMILACLLIKTPSNKLKEVEKLPDILTAMDVDFAAYALLYLLDGRKYLPEEFTKESDEGLKEMFSRWQDQPAQNSLPPVPLFYTEKEVKLKSKILGCEFEIVTAKESPAIEIAETFLAAFESFLATAIKVRAVARVPKVSIKLFPNEDSKVLISFDSIMDLQGNLSIGYQSFNPHHLSKDQNEAIGNALLETTAFVAANTVIFPQGTDSIQEMVTGRENFDRAFSFARSMVTIGNVLGYEYKQSVNDWFSDETKSYPYVPGSQSKLREADIKPDNRDGKLFDKDVITHDNLTMYTVTNDRVWQDAHWRGVSYMGIESINSAAPPAFVLMFAHEKNGKQIFELWRKEYGDKAGEEVRIAIIKGVDKNNPFWYTILIGPVKQPRQINKHFVIMTRLHTMNTESHNNLNHFIASFGRAKRFWFAPGYSPADSYEVDPFLDLGFWCKNFTVTNAWEIGPDDLDSMAIVPGSEPLIPPDRLKDAPVLETLKVRAARTVKTD